MEVCSSSLQQLDVKLMVQFLSAANITCCTGWCQPLTRKMFRTTRWTSFKPWTELFSYQSKLNRSTPDERSDFTLTSLSSQHLQINWFLQLTSEDLTLCVCAHMDWSSFLYPGSRIHHGEECWLGIRAACRGFPLLHRRADGAHLSCRRAARSTKRWADAGEFWRGNSGDSPCHQREFRVGWVVFWREEWEFLFFSPTSPKPRLSHENVILHTADITAKMTPLARRVPLNTLYEASMISQHVEASGIWCLKRLFRLFNVRLMSGSHVGVLVLKQRETGKKSN